MADAPRSRYSYKRRGVKPYDVSHSFVQRVTSSVTQLLPQPAWLSQWFSQSERGVGDHGATLVRLTAETSSNDPQPAGPPEISEDENSSDEEEENEEGQSAKGRPKIPVNRHFPPDSFRIHRPNDVHAEADGDAERDDESHDAELLPKTRSSGTIRQTKFISSTPAVGSQGSLHSSSRRLDLTYGSPILPVRTVHVERASEEILSQSTQTPSFALGNAEEKVNGGDDQSITSESTSVNSSLPVRPFTCKLRSLTPGPNKRRISGGDDDEDELEDARRQRGPRSLNLERKRARLIQNFNSSSASQHEMTLGSRNPSFNVDVYMSRKGSESRASSLLSSSFYAGETTYGGAAAYDRRKISLRHSSSPACFPRLGAVEVRPKMESPRVIDTGVSRTARRILDTLQQLSTPVREARGIPVPARRSQSPVVSKSGPPTRPLNMPSVPELLRLRQKERIQNTMSSARAVASSQKEVTQEEYSLRLGEFQGSSKYVSKMKSKQHSAFEEPAITLNLPNVPLPITTLPKFDLGFSAASLAATAPSTLPMFCSAGINISGSAIQTYLPSETVTTTKSTLKPIPVPSSTCQEVPVFTFRRPLDPQDEEAERAVLDSVVSALSRSISNVSSSSVSRESQVVSKSNNSSQNCALEGEKEYHKNLSPGAFSLRNESKKLAAIQVEVGDVNKQISEKWQCKNCAVKNVVDSDKCVCGQLRSSSSTESAGFGAQFKLSEGMWECSTCMVRNKTSDASCVACTSTRPGAKHMPSHDPQTCTKSGFGDKFKLPASSWECTTCLVRNPENLNRCQACTMEKPRGKQANSPAGGKPVTSMDQLKKQEGSWYCTVCMACNKPGTKKCSSCDYVNPNSNQSGLQFKFDIPAEASKFKFGVDNTGNNAAKSMIGSVCGFSFGGNTKTTTVVTTFSFGIPTTATSTVNSELCNTVSAEIPSGGKTGVPALSSSLQNKTENQNPPSKNSGSSKRPLRDEDRADNISKTRSLVDATDGKANAKKVSFCFEPSKGFGTTSNIVPKQSPVVSSSAGVLSTPTPSNSPLSSTRNNSSSPKSSFAANTSYSFSPGSLSAKTSPGHTKTSAEAVISGSVVSAKSNQSNTVISSVSKSSEVMTTSAATIPKEPPCNSESQNKLLTTAYKQTVDLGSRPDSSVSEASSGATVPKLATVFGSTSVKSALETTKIATFGTPTSSVASVVSNVNSASVAITTATVQGSSSSGSAFGTSVSASFTVNPSKAIFGTPSTVAQKFGSVATTTNSSLVFPTAVVPSATSVKSSVFGVTTSAATPTIFGVSSNASTPMFGAATTTTTTNVTPIFGATAVTTNTSTPVFGAATTTSTPLFGAVSVTATPVFGVTSTTATPVFGVITTTTTAAAITTTTTTASPIFGVGSTTAIPMFGASTTTPPVFGVASTTATSVFGVNTTTSSPAFGVATTVTPSAFGSVVTTSPSLFGSNTSASAPVFGGATATPSFGTTAPTPGFGASGSSFGAGSVTAPAFGAALSSGFGAPSTTSTAAFGPSTTLTQTFESSATPQVFGGVGTDTKSSLGQNTEKPVAPFAFGANCSGQATPSQTFLFAGNQSNSISKPDFSFGSANVSGPQRPGFGFGSSASQQPAPFGFGSNATVPAASATPFPSSSGTAAPAASPFGATQATGNFGGTNSSGGFASGGFNFGQSNTNAFGFSAAQAPAPAASTSTPAQPFQFGQATAVQFDPNAKPTFNFTGGETPVFTASPAGGTTAQPRRIKKAMRRAQR